MMSYLGENGLETIITISRDIDDGLGDKFLNMRIPIPNHSTCRKTYTKPSMCSSITGSSIQPQKTLLLMQK